MSKENDHLTWFVLQHIADNVQCQSCDGHFELDDILIVSRRGGTWFAKATCPHCGTESLIMVVLEDALEAEDFSEEALEDLEIEFLFDEEDMAETMSPALRHSLRGPITVREIEELREFLQSYRGNLSEYLGEPD